MKSIATHTDNDSMCRIIVGPKAVARTLDRLESARSFFPEGSPEWVAADSAVNAAFDEFGGREAVLNAIL